MKVNSKNLFFSFTAFLLLTALATPSVVKTIHALFEHQEVLCTQKSKVHCHQIELNCDFHQYHTTPYFFPKSAHYKLVISYSNFKINKNLYIQISKFQKSHFSLRGPPSLS
jgi:hypothetical protein